MIHGMDHLIPGIKVSTGLWNMHAMISSLTQLYFLLFFSELIYQTYRLGLKSLLAILTADSMICL